MRRSTLCIHPARPLRIQASIGARLVETKLPLQAVTLCRHKIISNIVPRTAKLSGSFWFIQFSSKRGACPTHRSSRPPPAATELKHLPNFRKETSMKITEMIEAVQKKLQIQVDGKAGSETWGAIYAAIVKPTIGGEVPELAISKVDDRSEKNIATLLPEVQPIARALVQKAAINGISIKIISGLRTYAAQDALYAKGRTAPGPKVTNARGGYSNHNFGIAFDVGVFSGANYLPNSPKYKAVGVLGMDLGLEWGGNWKSIVDQPHFQLRPAWAAALTERDMLAAFRDRVSNNQPVYA